MPVDPIGAALGIAGLVAALKGALDGYLLIESLFDKDNSLKDLATCFHVEREELKDWAARFNLYHPDPEECLLYYETDENRKLLFEILNRIDVRLAEAQDLLDYHTRGDAQQKSFKIRNLFNKRRTEATHAVVSQYDVELERNRIRWAIKNKAKFEEIVTTLTTHNENLNRRSKRIETLEPEKWNRVVLWLTRIDGTSLHIDETSLHSRAQQVRLEGTGRWIFSRTEFEYWLSGEAKDILWIQATRK